MFVGRARTKPVVDFVVPNSRPTAQFSIMAEYLALRWCLLGLVVSP